MDANISDKGRNGGHIMAEFNILLVEDDEDWQYLLPRKLETAMHSIGCKGEIKVIKTFQSASEALEKNPWHLMVTDIGLGDETVSWQMLGIQLVEQARDLKVPSLVVSGTPVVKKGNVRDILMKYGAVDYFDKGGPFDGERFIAKVQEILQNCIHARRKKEEEDDLGNNQEKRERLDWLEIQFLALSQTLNKLDEDFKKADTEETFYYKKRQSIVSDQILHLRKMETLLQELGLADVASVITKSVGDKPDKRQVENELFKVAEKAADKRLGRTLIEQIKKHSGDIADIALKVAIQMARSTMGIS